MPSGNKKKKKASAAANPARGFATTSIASKPKAVEQPTLDATSTEASGIPTPVDAVVETKAGPANAASDAQLHELSPEQLEAHLEASELQQFVEKHAAKVKKETARQVNRLQTDRRILRGQAEFLPLKEWLPDELMQQVLDLALSSFKHESEQERTHSLARGDDLVVKIWSLRQSLLNLSIPLDRISEVLAWFVANPPADGTTLTIDDCLEWLVLHCNLAELDEYDVQKPKPMTAFPDESDEEPETMTQTRKADSSHSSSDKENDPLLANEPVDVSDLDSDLDDPDEMLRVYLRTQSRLYELNAASNPNGRPRGKGPRNLEPNKPKTSLELRLEQKLRKLESDVLFDQREAESQWVLKRNELAKEAAERRRLQLHVNSWPASERPSDDSAQDTEINEEAEKLGRQLLEESADAEDDGLLNGIFDAVPGVDQSGDQSPTTSAANVTIRDFGGKITGLNPKRVLEEACKARDSRCILKYNLISPTTYASRHSVTIQWTKTQELVMFDYLQGVQVKQRALSITVSMTQVAAPDVAQSEAFVATAALFLVFSGSPKEERTHLRLPSNFRVVWDEFDVSKRGHIDGEDAAQVKEIRGLVEKHRRLSDHDEDEVVFNAASRRKLEASNGTSTPGLRPTTPTQATNGISPELRQAWQRKTETPAYQQMLSARMNLPMFQHRQDALETIRRNQVTIICGDTGCGKSTQIPALLLEDQLANGKDCKIYCTEPRRISAISLAQRVSQELGEKKGDIGTARSLVGYAIRLESQTVAQTKLIYATVGIVLRMLENANGLSEVTHLIIDEVHERSIDTDFLLIVLRSLLQRRPDLRVVLMSATVDASRFSQYLDGAPIINVPGRTFPVQVKFAEDAIELTSHTIEDAGANAVDEEDADDEEKQKVASTSLQGYSKRTKKVLEDWDEYRIDFSLIVKLIEKVAYDPNYQPFSKAILVFLPGIAEIRQLNDMLAGSPKFNQGWRIHALHSTFSSEDQQLAFEIPPEGIRKICLATNVAETGITIADITCVIDTGKHKEMRFDERRQMSRLTQSFIARANAKQRRGRAGRVQEGLCFHLFTKQRHDQLMAEQQTPEMLRLSLQDLIMKVKICKLGDIEAVLSQALDPPSSKNVRRAIDALVEVGALTSNEDLTSLGNQLAKLPLDAQLGKLILLGSIFGCLDFALTAAAALSSKSPFLNPMHAKKQADTVRLGFKRGDSDLLTVFNAYTSWRKVCTTAGISEFSYCNKNFLSSQNLGNIEDLKGQLLSSLVDAGFVQLGPEERQALARIRHNHYRHRNFVALPAKYNKAIDDDNLTSSVITWSFYPKLIKRDGNGWRNVAKNQSLGLHPTSVNRHSLPPEVKYLSFYSIMQSSSRLTSAQETSAVADFALALLAGEAVFHMYAGVIAIDGNRLRFKVRDWKTMVALKALRVKVREAVAKLLKYPGRGLGDRLQRWMDCVHVIFGRQMPETMKLASR